MAAPKAKPASTAVGKAKVTNLPVDLKAQREAEVAAMKARLAVPSGNQIKAKKGVFIMPDGGTAEEIDVIIVDFISRNEYYENGYDETNLVPPNCFAIGLEPTGLCPSENSPDCQGESCVTCWAGQWKSARTGNGKACNNNRWLAVRAADSEPDAPLMKVKVTATALKSFDGYVASLARAGVVPRDVITHVTLDPNLEYASLRFSDPVPCTDAQMAISYARRGDAMELLMVEPDVSGFVKAVPKAKGKAPARKAA